MSVTAIVVAYNSSAHLEKCLKGILDDPFGPDQLVVVDNASSDDSARIAEEFSRHDDRVEVIRSEDNLGLAGGVNRALESVQSDYLAILNPDVTPRAGWITPLVSLMASDPSIGVACPLVLTSTDGRVNSAGQHVHVTGLGFNRHLGKGPDAVESEPIDVGGLHGAAFVIRTDLLRSLGGWDTTGFLYQEDVALSWDILLSGWRIIFVPESVVAHDYHLTMYPEKLYLLERNRWGLLISHLSASRLALIALPILVSELMVWGLALIRGPRFVRAKWRAVRWVLTNRDAIGDWRDRVFSRPTYDSGNLMRSVRWSYPISQLFGLGAERGDSARVPPGGLPV